MPATTGAFSNVIAPGLKEVFATNLQQAPFQGESILKTGTSTKHTESYLSRSTLGAVPIVTEGAGVTYDDINEGYKKTYTHTQYGLGFQVTRVMWEDDLYGVMVDASRGLAESARITVETACANVFNNGFSSSYPGGDALALFSAVHTLIEGGTSANAPSTNCDLSKTTLKAALTAFRNMRDDRNNKLVIQPKYLIVPAALEFTALELTQSRQDPETGNNAINPINGRLQVIVWDYLTDDDAWFISAGPQNSLMRARLIWRVRPQFTNKDDFSTDNALFKVRMRFSTGFDDWRGLYGTSGG